jgi:hypothetical protein
VDAARAVGVALSRVLDAAEDASPVQAVEAVTRELSAALNASVVSFLIADLSGRGLVRLAQIKMSEGIATLPPGQGNDWRDNDEATELVPFDGGPAEEALRTQTLQVVKGGAPEQWTVLAPVTERGESLGLLEMCVPVEPTEQVIEDITRIAHVLGFVVIANRRHTDLFEWGQRSTRFTLPAEIQRGSCRRRSPARRGRSRCRRGSSRRPT